MSEPKTVLEPAAVKTAQATTNAEPVVAAKKKFRFFKNMAPAEVVTLADGRKIEFRVPKTHNGAYLNHGVFETEDDKLANLIRQAAAKNSCLFIFEIK